MVIINDGAGKGNKAKVTSLNQLSVESTTRPQSNLSADLGDTYDFPTDVIVLQPGDENAIAYIQNTSERILSIDVVRASCSGSVQMRVYKNPTDGGIIDGSGIAVTPVNTNFQSGKSFQGTFNKGDGTIDVNFSNGTLLTQQIITSSTESFNTEGRVQLGTNDTIGITAQTDSGLALLGVTIVAYYRDSE